MYYYNTDISPLEDFVTKFTPMKGSVIGGWLFNIISMPI